MEKTKASAAPEQFFLEDLIEAQKSAQNYLFKIQTQDGYWCGELEGDTILESEYILTLCFIGHREEPRLKRAASFIRKNALPEGGWAIYPGGPPDVSASVKAYFALKLLGEGPDHPHMKSARETILRLGGLEAVNSFTRIYLAMFGQYPWDKCPAVPPELILLPQWFPISLYNMSAWSRCIVVPLSIIRALQPKRDIPAEAGIIELWSGVPFQKKNGSSFWANFFQMTDAVLRFVERYKWTPWRQKGLKACESWMVEHCRKSDGIGAIFPPIINSIIAFHCLGYGDKNALFQSQVRELQKLEIADEDGTSIKIAPCYSPVWDTVLAINALVESGVPSDHPGLQKATTWVLSKEVRETGDWLVKNPQGKPGGWYFEFANEFYPDTDDTFQVLTALSKIPLTDPESEKLRLETVERAVQWLLTMQNKDGGWGSFDRDCNKKLLTHVPFADHNAMIDPSTSDITGRGLEALSHLGYGADHRVIRRAIRFLEREQESDGTWFGRWGCNYIYGTWLALTGLKCQGADMGSRPIQAAAKWLINIQNPDGGWGESLYSYEDPSTKGRGRSTASQTAWAVMALIAAGHVDSRVVEQGIDFLIETQLEDGGWRDESWTGTGFPSVFYLRYHLYAVYFPLLALALYERGLDQTQGKVMRFPLHITTDGIGYQI